MIADVIANASQNIARDRDRDRDRELLLTIHSNDQYQHTRDTHGGWTHHGRTTP